jgi:penicillin-binding protein 1A
MRRSLGHGEVGGRTAAPIWANFMRNMMMNESASDFSVPDGIVKLSIDPATGLLSTDEKTGIFEYFKTGTQPTKYSTPAGKIEKTLIKMDYD